MLRSGALIRCDNGSCPAPNNAHAQERNNDTPATLGSMCAQHAGACARKIREHDHRALPRGPGGPSARHRWACR
jgi:hypothetical protein